MYVQRKADMYVRQIARLESRLTASRDYADCRITTNHDNGYIAERNTTISITRMIVVRRSRWLEDQPPRRGHRNEARPRIHISGETRRNMYLSLKKKKEK